MKLNRANLAAMNRVVTSKPRLKIVHIGLGAFHRAHQAWYTARVDIDQQWGIVSFTGRSAKAAEEISAQDGLYTLIVRDSVGDSFQIIDSIAQAEDGNNVEVFNASLCDPDIAIVSLTITEAGYGLDSDGRIDPNNPTTVLARLAEALELRRNRIGLGLAVVSCDNMPSNGELLRVAMRDLFATFGREAIDWLAANVSFVSTSVDRITPKTTQADIALVQRATGWSDSTPVVTEPFSDWVLQGNFPLGRPQWELAGAKFVADIEPFENRKLWLLNGSHSLLAYLGQLRGHETVAEAIADDFCLEKVEAFWNEAANHLGTEGLEIPQYRDALIERFKNSRIAHRLAQIAIDGSTKLRMRVAPVAKAELAAGRDASACAFALATWVAFAIEKRVVQDTQLDEITGSLYGEIDEVVVRLVSLVDPQLPDHTRFMNLVLKHLEAFSFTPSGNRLPNSNKGIENA